jgi:recombination protein RecR
LVNIIPKNIQNLIDQFSTLPGIGPKTASRLTFYLLHQPDSEIAEFGNAVIDMKKNIVNCSICFNISQTDPCEICSNKNRNQSQICVVENPLDIVALEKTGNYQGLYHILGGAISPIDNIGPDDLKIKELFDRIKKDPASISEVILASNPDLEGEATAMFIVKQIEKEIPKNKIKITRIARGLPVGSDLEYADEMTLARSMEGRKEY